MKVIYDARWLPTDGLFFGIARYSHELGNALARQPDIDITWLISNKKQLAFLEKRPYVLGNDPSDIFKESKLPKLLNSYQPDIVYSPAFSMGFTGTKGRQYKLVLTIHDLIYFSHRTPPQWLPVATRIAWRLFHLSKWPIRKTLNKADIIATVSNTAKSELQKYRVTTREIVTVSNAVSHAKKPVLTNHHDSKDIVYMGSFTPYKNVECLIMALKHLPDITLHLLSSIPRTRRKELTNFIKNHGVQKQVVLHNGVSDKQYHEVLKKSRCLVSASRIEGFGLPLIEAQQHGVPVVCSDIPIFREVVGDSALLFNPDEPEACAQAIKQLADKQTSKTYITRGIANAKTFSWEDSAKQARKICEKLVK